jgi:Tfp pilus assembly protein PilF
LQPTYSVAYASRGLLKEKVNKDLAGAQADLDKAIALRPDYYLGYQYRANLRHLQGDTAGADADLRKAQELQPH